MIPAPLAQTVGSYHLCYAAMSCCRIRLDMLVSPTQRTHPRAARPMAQVFDVERGARGELRLAACAPAAPPAADGALPGAAPVLALVPAADAHAPLPRHTIPLAQLVGCAAPLSDTQI